MESGRIEGFRLSPQQKHLWQLQQEGRDYRAAMAILLEGNLNRPAFAEALQKAVEQHEILRTSFQRLPGLELPLQVIAEDAAPHCREVDLTAIAAGEQKARVEEIFAGESRAAFDFEQGPLLRCALLRLADEQHIWIVNLPSLCADMVTLDNLVQSVSAFYAARVRGDAPPDEPVQYVDFSEWQNELLEADEARAGQEFWATPGFEPFAHPSLPLEGRPAEGAEGDAPLSTFACRLKIAPELSRRLPPAAHASTVSAEVFLLACWQVLLWRLTGQRDLVIYVCLDGRKAMQLKSALGLFAKYLPVRCHLEGDYRLAELLEATDAVTRRAYEYQEYFLWNRPAHSDGDKAALPVCFDFNESRAPLTAAGLTFSAYQRRNDIERHKLRLSCHLSGEELTLEYHYDPAVYEAGGIRRLAAQLEALLDAAARQPQQPLCQLAWLSAAERAQLLEEWNGAAVAYDRQATVAAAFEEQARRTPWRVAVVSAGEAISYEELNRRANQLGRYLRGQGVEAEGLVGVCVERGVGMVVGVLGAMKGGGGYVPLDMGQPKSRLKQMLRDAGVGVVLTEEHLLDLLPEYDGKIICVDSQWPLIAQESAENFISGAGPDNLAYVIYTSGSTGRPKGSMIQHQSVIGLAKALDVAVYDHQPRLSRVSLNAPLAFDGSVKQWIQLLGGRTLYIVPEHVRRDGDELLDYVHHNGLEVFDCTPSQLRLLIETSEKRESAASPAVVLVGGEALDAPLWNALAEKTDTDYFNVYGPTECTVNATVARVSQEQRTPTIGQPISNVRVYILDEWLNPVAIGVAGELHIGGSGVGRGYLDHPQMTAERFIPDPFGGQAGARLYKTGDLARYLPDGNIEYIGRGDHQVKVRGYRIELGEIEATIKQHPAVRDVVVLAREDRANDKRLVAYIVSRVKAGLESDAATHYRLPNGMTVAHQNKNETDYLYEEIFEKQTYIKYGVQLPQSACVFDVGANIGLFTLFVSQQCREARIYAFEPILPIFESLKINAHRYAANVKLFPIGLSDQERTSKFTYYPRYSMMSGLSDYARPQEEVEVIKRFLRNEEQTGVEGAGGLLEHADELLEGRFANEDCLCRLRTLSDVINEERVESVDLLKIDVQRAEMDVLRGIRPEDWRKIHQIVMEVHDASGQESEGRVEEISELLSGYGFEVMVEQDVLLLGTDRFNLYATRGDGKRNGSHGARPAASNPPLTPELSPAAFSAGELREFLRDKLPDYMLPAAFVVVDALPLTRNGKIDRGALLSLEQAPTAPEEAAFENRTPIEEVLIGLWSKVLGVDRLGVRSNFFDVGGHSLLATQVVSRAKEVFEVDIPLRTLFNSPTVAGFARSIEEIISKGQAAPPRSISRVARDQDAPLSFAQQRLWFFDRLEPGTSLYHCIMAAWLIGPLKVEALERALSEIVRRHEILRTSFPTKGGKPSQVIAPAAPLKLAAVDLCNTPEGEWEAVVQQEAADAMRLPFDLAGGPLIRVKLLRFSEREHAFVITMHHIIADDWSVAVLTQEVAALYEAFVRDEPAPLPELPIQYVDFTYWQHEWLESGAFAEQLAYWQHQLAGELPVLKLPSDRPHPQISSFRGRTRPFELSPALMAKIKALSRNEGATVAMVLLAALKVLIHRYTGAEDVIIGSPIANRNRTEIEPLIGCFINMIVLRTRLSFDMTFGELLAKVRETSLAAYAHQDVPFEKLVEVLQPERTLSHNPLFQICFDFHNTPIKPIRLRDLELLPLELDSGKAEFDFVLTVWEAGQGLSGVAIYRTDLFDPETINNLLTHYEKVLEAVVTRVDWRLIDIPLAGEKPAAAGQLPAPQPGNEDDLFNFGT